ncbi:hypothetical protein ACF0H5_022806 [Mactra antiquata]
MLFILSLVGGEMEYFFRKIFIIDRSAYLSEQLLPFSRMEPDWSTTRKCGREIVELVDIVNVKSPQALKIRNETIGHTEEILIQLFKNPHGHKYEVITSSKASVFRASTETSSDTWWPGYNWIILGCPQCKQHIGWEYIPRDKKDPEKRSFYGLVFNNLLFENDAENLIVLPKSYQS